MATQKSWGNRREKGMPASLSTGWRGAAPTPQTCRPRPASARVEGTRAHCSEAGSSPEGRGRGVKSSQPSLPLLGRLGAEAQKPRPAPPHSCTVSLPWALSPCCFSVCLITKQKLPSGLLYFYM